MDTKQATSTDSRGTFLLPKPLILAIIWAIVAAPLVALADSPATKPTRPRRGEILVAARVTEGVEERRGGAARHPGADEDLYVVVLAPQVRGNGATTLAQPTLFWSLSKDTRFPIQVTVNRLGVNKETLFDKTIRPPHKGGLRKLDFVAERDDEGRQVSLEPGVRYEMTVAVLVREDEASANPVGVALIERLPDADPPVQAAEVADPYERAVKYAASGAWLDALAALKAAMEGAPADAELSEAWAKMLQAQGLRPGPAGTVTIKKAERATPARPEE